MGKPIFTYGAISGLVVILSIIGSIELDVPYQWLGYLIMLIALSAIYIAIQQYRDEKLGGTLTFTQGMQLGLGITVVATVLYAVGWETYLALTNFEFAETYTAMLIEETRASGATEAEIAAMQAQIASYMEQYANPVFRFGISMLEILPVGVLVSLISAGLLRSRNK